MVSVYVACKGARVLSLGALLVLLPSLASAQDTAGTADPGSTGGAAKPASAPQPAAAPTTAPAPAPAPAIQAQSIYGVVAPPPPGVALGGGNVTNSSSLPITGPNQRDGFDLAPGGNAGATVRGNTNASYVLGQGPIETASPNAEKHTVKKGDTLWGICDTYLRNPYQWPRIWSYNPEIENPHWIYPGNEVKLRQPSKDAAAKGAKEEMPAGNAAPRDKSLVAKAKVPSGTVFLRNEGYIEDEGTQNWGEISGAPVDKMFLTDNDALYLRIVGDHEIKIGQELTIYRPIKKAGDGTLIEIQGTVRVDQWNQKEGIARAKVTETLDAIERGARVGPLRRQFEVVPPKRNEKDVEANVLTSVHAHNFFGQHQVVFINKGEGVGLEVGNRLQVIRQGDAWHKSLTTRSSARRIALESDSAAAVEYVPGPRDDSSLPEEVVGELRVISVRKNTAMCILTGSRREIEEGDRVVARKGY